MKELGCIKPQSHRPDIFFFFYQNTDTGILEGISMWHVGDVEWGGHENFYNRLMKPILTEFNFGTGGEETFEQGVEPEIL